jgi:hypothetical protein
MNRLYPLFRSAVQTATPLAATLLTAMLLAAGGLVAQDAFSFSEDDLFAFDDIIEVVEDSGNQNIVDSLLVTEGIRIGGSFSGNATVSASWDDPWSSKFFDGTENFTLVPSLNASLFFDARPSAGSRFYGSFRTSWPFETSTKVLTGAEYVPADTNPLNPKEHIKTTSTTITTPNVKVFELFSDFNWDGKAFFRFGKQTVSWGVGYFFSPADVINMQAIDPENPTAQREGPVTLRLHVPVPRSQHNLWAYAIVDSTSKKPYDTAAAVKAEFVLGAWEFGVGGWYKNEHPLRGMLTASGSVGKVGLFGEAYLARGSDRSWVTEVSPALAATGFVSREENKESAFFKGTAGFSYSNSTHKISLAGQYLYDGEGYSNEDRKARITEARDSEDAIRTAMAMLGMDADTLFPLFLKGLILNSGRHYAAFSFNRSDLLVKKLNFSFFAMGNLSDFSGFARPSLSYRLFDGMSLSTSAMFAFGLPDSEYLVLNDGPALNLSFSLSLGGGRF